MALGIEGIANIIAFPPMIDTASSPASQTLEFQWELHRQHMERAISSRQESDWHDFKAGIFTDSEAENLCKDVVALASTRGGPYGGYRYIIIGVHDTGEVTGLVGRDVMTEDVRQGQIKNKVQDGIDPYINVMVREFVVEGQRIHLLVIPETPLHWYLVRLPKHLQGHWLRRGRASERPLLADYAQHHAELVDQATAPLRTQQEGLQGQVSALKQSVSDLKNELTPANLSAIEFVTTAFATPDRILLRHVRRLISDYQEQAEEQFRLFNDLDVDRVLEHPELRTPQKIAAIKTYFEVTEANVRPLIEIVAHTIHEVPYQGKVPGTVLEVTQAIAESSVHQLRLPRFQDAVRAYPAQLYLHGVALASYHADDWRLFRDVMLYVHEFPSLTGQHAQVWLASKFAQRTVLDEVARLFEPVPTAPHPAANRISRLISQTDWVGETLPVSRRFAHDADGEALLSFGFLTGVATYYPHSPLTTWVNWWTYLNADQILTRVLERWSRLGTPLFDREVVQLAGRLLDDLDKPGSNLTVKATDLLLRFHPQWANEDWWNEGLNR